MKTVERKTRLETCEQLLKTDPRFSRNYSRLSDEEREIFSSFCRENEALEKAPFNAKAYRMFLDRAKPKGWTLLESLLVGVNTIARADE